ncbi:uncharacterized protein JCM6883_002552 [Sporobolomyces salmoneus]|uniref:uncharacterized protein n=1 Tax=Sporobolomyces salmoneus TaxID=183962 RepID=UPI003177EF90
MVEQPWRHLASQKRRFRETSAEAAGWDRLKIDLPRFPTQSLRQIFAVGPSLTFDCYNLFSSYDFVVSARVVTDPLTSHSKETGFVSVEEQNKQLSRGPKWMENWTGSSTSRLQEVNQPWFTSWLVLPRFRPMPSLLLSLSRQRTPPCGQGVKILSPQNAGEVVQLIKGLPKKERLMCLFNPDTLQQKVQDALLVLEASKEEGLRPQQAEETTTATDGDKPNRSVLHCRRNSPFLIRLFAKLPAFEIVRLLPVATPVLQRLIPSPEKLESFGHFMEEFEGLPVGQIKQKLGENLSTVVTNAGVKRAPKITIDLLDTGDLNSDTLSGIGEKALLLSAA